MGILWNRSGMVERYGDDIKAAGAKAFFYAGGTTTPLVVFRDAGESSAHPFPLLADANGRWPDVFIPYTLSFDVQVKTADDVQLTYTLQVPNPNPVDVSVTVPPANTVQTGMIHCELLNGTKSGYVRLNGRTMGSSASSGTERANDDTLALYSYLWSNLTDAVAPVSGGRGGSAATDFSPGNKTITLPSWQGVGPAGLDDMGAAAGSFFAGLTFNVGNATTAGSLTGSNGVALDLTNMPPHSHGGSTSTDGFVITNKLTSIQDTDHRHTGTTNANSGHSHAAFIHEPVSGHSHPSGDALSQPYSYRAVSGGSDAAGLGGGSQMHSSTTTGSATTGVKVNSAAGGAGTDDVTANENTHTHSFNGTAMSVQSADHKHTFSITAVESQHNHTFTTSTVGGTLGAAVAFNNLGRSRLVTWFIKL
jgi:hypothetical protein